MTAPVGPSPTALPRHVADLQRGQVAWFPTYSGSHLGWMGPFVVLGVSDGPDRGFTVWFKGLAEIGTLEVTERAAFHGARVQAGPLPRRPYTRKVVQV